MRTYMFSMLLASLILIAACSDPRPQADPEVPLEQQVEMVRADIQTGLEEIEYGLDDLESRMEEAGDETRAMLKETLAALRAQHDKLYRDLDQLEHADEEALYRQEWALTERLREMETELVAVQFDALPSREAFEDAVEDRLTELDRTLTALETQAQETAPGLDGAFTDVFANLHRQRQEVAVQVEHLQEASEEMFQAKRSHLAEAVARLSTEINAATDRVEDTLNEEETTPDRASL